VIRLLLMLVLALSLVGCSPKRVYRQPDPAAPTSDGAARMAVRPPGDPTSPAVAQTVGAEVALLADAQIGRPYRWGGRSPEQGFDCSGLVHWAYARVGVDLPRVVRDQQRVGRPVPEGDLAPGDLVFFSIEGGRISHVGVYVGDADFVHAPRRGKPVRRDSLDDPYWRERWNDSRRVAAE
jgi:cell wall-associated NlpC family hydrolase